MATKPKIPAPLPPPAARPERNEAASPEDIVLGGEDELMSAARKAGKRSLTRPTSGVKV